MGKNALLKEQRTLKEKARKYCIKIEKILLLRPVGIEHTHKKMPGGLISEAFNVQIYFVSFILKYSTSDYSMQVET